VLQIHFLLFQEHDQNFLFSGAGKTTLLAAISQRIRGNLTGELEINGCSVTRNEMTKLSGFVSQYDITIDSLTAAEHMYFMVKILISTQIQGIIIFFIQTEMKMGKNVTKANKIRHVGHILNKLGLTKSADVKISSLSGGERKKLNLATEVLKSFP
jgi:ATP-binding cassette, subfamily G (WHITE), eye pigment precursor transporter